MAVYRILDTATGDVVLPVATNAGAPTSGTSGTLVGIAQPGSLLIDTTNKALYQNTNTAASPTWTANTLAGSSPTFVSATFSAGTATVAPLTLASGTNLTTAAAGAVEFDGSAFYATAKASSRQVVNAEQYAILAADYTLANVNTAQAALNATATGALTLAAGTYAFEAEYYVTNTGTTSHTWSTLFGGTAVLTSIGYAAFGNSLTAAGPAAGTIQSGYVANASAAAVTAASTSATEFVTVLLRGVVVIGTAGTIIPQVKLSAAPGGAQTMKAGSYFRAWALAGTGAVGNWS